MSQQPTLLVLAAGIGSRYGGLKQIDPIGPSGEVVLDYSVYDAMQAGFGKVVFIIRKDIEKDFKETLGPHFKGRIPVEYVFQELDKLPEGYDVPEGRTKPWGTSHAMLMAADAIEEPFCVINADDFYGREAFDLMHQKLVELGSGTGHYTMVAFNLAKTLSENGGVSRGVCRVEDGYLAEVLECHGIERQADGTVPATHEGEAKMLEGNEPVSMNFWGFTPDVFGHANDQMVDFLKTLEDMQKGECLVPVLVDDLIKAGKAKCEVMSSDDKWYGVTYPDDKASVQSGIRSLVDAGLYPENLWAKD